MPYAVTPGVPSGDQAPEGHPALPPGWDVNWNPWTSFFRPVLPPRRGLLDAAGEEALRRLRQTPEELELERQERARRKFNDDAAARALLLSMLDDDNRVRLQRKGYIEITGSAGGLYRLWACSYSGNIQHIVRRGDRELIRRLCAHPPMSDAAPLFADGRSHAPYDHALIAQLLALRYDERRVLEVALDA